MKTDELILRLVRDTRPVERAPRPIVLFASWSISVAIYLWAAVAAIGARGDLARLWLDVEFVVHSLAVVCVTLLAAAATFALGIPGRRRRWILGSSAIALAAWLGWIVDASISQSAAHAGFGWNCLRNVVLLAVPPGVLGYALLMRTAPLRTATAGWLACLSAAAAADLATRFICRNDHALHALVWHFVPVLVVGCIGFVLGPRLLRWETDERP